MHPAQKAILPGLGMLMENGGPAQSSAISTKHTSNQRILIEGGIPAEGSLQQLRHQPPQPGPPPP